MTFFAIVNGQRVEVPPDDGMVGPPGGGLLSKDPAAGLAKPAAAPAEADEGPEAFAKHYLAQINPIPLGQLLPFPEKLGGGGAWAPFKAADALLKAQGEPFTRAKKAFDEGDYTSAAIHAMHWLMPVLGPILDKAGVELKEGKFAAGAGDTAGLATAIFGTPKVLAPLERKLTAPRSTLPAKPFTPSNLTAEELASNAFAAEHGIPLDAATATGSRFVGGVQKVAGESMFGSGPAERARIGQAENLNRVGEELAGKATAQPVLPEQAGKSVADAITSVIQKLHNEANEAYGKLREFEARPEHASDVPDANRSAGVKARQAVEEETLGRVVTDSERMELRRILEELENIEYQNKTYHDAGRGRGGDLVVEGRKGNAPVYHDINDEAASEMTAQDMKADIRKALQDGKYRVGAKAALEVARKRAAGLVTEKPGVVAGKVSKPLLPMGPGFGEPGSPGSPARPATQSMPLAVDMRDAKAALEPLYQRLKREGELAPLMGGKAKTLYALDRLMTGPDYAPLSIADAALSDLKAISRTDGLPELRSPGKAGAAYAVKQLGEAIDLRAVQAGDEVFDALRKGRAATMAKHEAGDLLEGDLPDKAVGTFDRLVAPRDANIELLRKVQQIAPKAVPDLARATLQRWLDTATERGTGKFMHADKLYAEWQKLGPATKRVLFPDPKLVESLDDFFLLAKRIGENPNPPNTAGTLIKVSEVTVPMTALATMHPLGALGSLASSAGLGGLAKILYSPEGVKALTTFLRSRAAKGATVGGAVSSARPGAALIQLANAAKAAGVDLPLAADRDQGR